MAWESSSEWKLEEQRIEVDTTGATELKGCYDMSWRTRIYNSNSGSGCMVGHNTGKSIDYETRNKDCRLCNIAAKTEAKPKEHNCRKSHTGSSKSMELSVSKVLSGKSNYKVMITDEDGTTESKVKANVNRKMVRHKLHCSHIGNSLT